jgi:hypothetical protein
MGYEIQVARSGPLDATQNQPSQPNEVFVRLEE